MESIINMRRDNVFLDLFKLWKWDSFNCSLIEFHMGLTVSRNMAKSLAVRSKNWEHLTVSRKLC